MGGVEIRKGIYWAGVNDRTTDLFEGLWPIDGVGVSYNSYIINDEKKVLVDLAKAFKTDVFFDQIASVVDIADIDYVIVNHMEPDHTGVLNTLKRMSPKMTILCSPKAVPMLRDYYGLEHNIRAVADGETLSIGSRELKFFHTPFVHWPETMMTYDPSQKVLFSCDAFGGYGAHHGAIFDDECTDLPFYEKESLRYYTNIVAKFSTPVLNAIEKLGPVPVDVIAPSHGLVWRGNPGRIIELYKKWSEYAAGDNEPTVVLLYGSMYGNTETMMNAVSRGISDQGVEVTIFDVARTHVSYILPELWTSRGVMIGAPTYEGSLFPYMSQVLEKAALKNVKNKKTAYFGSYGWSKGAYKKTISMVEPLGWEMTDALEFPGGPDGDTLEKGYEFGAKFAKLVKNK